MKCHNKSCLQKFLQKFLQKLQKILQKFLQKFLLKLIYVWISSNFCRKFLQKFLQQFLQKFLQKCLQKFLQKFLPALLLQPVRALETRSANKLFSESAILQKFNFLKIAEAQWSAKIQQKVQFERTPVSRTPINSASSSISADAGARTPHIMEFTNRGSFLIHFYCDHTDTKNVKTNFRPR